MTDEKNQYSECLRSYADMLEMDFEKYLPRVVSGIASILSFLASDMCTRYRELKAYTPQKDGEG